MAALTACGSQDSATSASGDTTARFCELLRTSQAKGAAVETALPSEAPALVKEARAASQAAIDGAPAEVRDDLVAYKAVHDKVLAAWEQSGYSAAIEMNPESVLSKNDLKRAEQAVESTTKYFNAHC